MIKSLNVAARRIQPTVEVAVIIVDDNPDGRAKEVIEGIDHQFLRGIHYVFSGAQNISKARNLGIDKALELGDWVAMADDDQTVVEDWFKALIAIQEKFDADCVTGPVFLRYEKGSASWLTDEPFETILEATVKPDGAEVDVCSTGNSMIRGSFLIEHPDIRFRDDLGKVGGEDMVFYRAAIGAGLEARFSTDAICYGEQPASRESLKYQLKTSYWMGNTEYLTNVESGSANKSKMFLRASKRSLKYLLRPFKRMFKQKNPQFRFAIAGIAQTMGIFVGVLGKKVDHPD